MGLDSKVVVMSLKPGKSSMCEPGAIWRRKILQDRYTKARLVQIHHFHSAFHRWQNCACHAGQSHFWGHLPWVVACVQGDWRPIWFILWLSLFTLVCLLAEVLSCRPLAATFIHFYAGVGPFYLELSSTRNPLPSFLACEYTVDIKACCARSVSMMLWTYTTFVTDNTTFVTEKSFFQVQLSSVLSIFSV